jgi:hypothetical protein
MGSVVPVAKRPKLAPLVHTQKSAKPGKISPPAKDVMKDINKDLAKIIPRYPEVNAKKARPMTSIPKMTAKTASRDSLTVKTTED